MLGKVELVSKKRRVFMYPWTEKKINAQTSSKMEWRVILKCVKVFAPLLSASCDQSHKE